MEIYAGKNKPCYEQLQANKDHVNHLIESGLAERDRGNLDSAAVALMTASAETVFIQLQRLYLSPEFEENTRGQFRSLRESLIRDLNEIKDRYPEALQDAGDDETE